MANQTKMIIITSDEDIIRQFSFNKTKNTQIIDLDNGNQVISTASDNKNITNLNLLAQLSGINSNNDQIYKRALDSSDQNRSKPVKVSKKSINAICVICGDHAVGFNYDVLSCSSCKAFFRRNANQNLENLRCLTGQGQCSVVHSMRRKCPRCRLNRCFAMGMRKDFILTEEEKQQRKKRVEENRKISSTRSSTSESTNSSSTPQSISNSESILQASDEIDRLLMEINKDDDDDIVLDENTNLNEIKHTLFETLSIEDWIVIQSVRSSFLSVFDTPSEQFSKLIDLSDRVSALISWSEFTSQIALRFIKFFRQIDEFESLDADDRFILIKYNLFLLFPIYKCFSYKSINDYHSSEELKEAESHKQFLTLCGFTDSCLESFMDTIKSLVKVTEQDPTLLSLLIIILLYSPGLSMSDNEPLLKDPLTVNRVQSHYTRVLWNYLINRWNELHAWRYFTQLLAAIFQIQTATKTKLDIFRAEFTTFDAVDKISPMMQAFLHIS